MGQHVFVYPKTRKEAEVMIRMTKEHEGKPRVPPNESIDTVDQHIVDIIQTVQP